MVATSVISKGSETLDVFTRRSQPKIEINLQGQTPGLVNSYTTGDQIEGTVTITVDHETRFDEVEIVLQGKNPPLFCLSRISSRYRYRAHHGRARSMSGPHRIPADVPEAPPTRG